MRTIEPPQATNIIPLYSRRAICALPEPTVATRMTLPIGIPTHISVSFEIADSELRDFQAYADWSNQRWSRDFCLDLKASLIVCGRSHNETPKPFNKPCAHGVPSRKALVARSRKLMKQGQNTALKIELPLEIWQKLRAVADYYGISFAEICQSAIGYHAALWRHDVVRNESRAVR